MRPNAFYNSCIPYFEFFIHSLKTPRVNIPRPTPVESLKKKKDNYLFLIKNREAFLLSMSIPPLDSALNKILALSWKEAFVSLRAASLLYNKVNNRIPNQLSELTPKYISIIPNDVFSGEEIKLNSEKGILYVVGPDLIDNSGKRGRINWATQRDYYEGDITQTIFPNLENSN